MINLQVKDKLFLPSLSTVLHFQLVPLGSARYCCDRCLSVIGNIKRFLRVLCFFIFFLERRQEVASSYIFTYIGLS